MLLSPFIIASGEISGTPQTVANQLECTGEHCTHLFDSRIGKKNTEASVGNVADIESIYWTDPVSNNYLTKHKRAYLIGSFVFLGMKKSFFDICKSTPPTFT